jgi:hypothetical protein
MTRIGDSVSECLPEAEKLRRLRIELDKGLRSLEVSKGEPLDIEKFIEEQHARLL